MLSKNHRFTLEDVAAQFPRDTFIRGMDYANDNKVKGWSFENDFIESEVQGSGRNIYTQEIELIFDGKGALEEVIGGCSCPVEYNCKHTVAVLLNILDHQQKKSPSGKPAIEASLSFAEQKWLHELEFAQNTSHINQYVVSHREEKTDDGFLIFTLSTLGNGKEIRLIPGKAKLNAKGELKYTKLSQAVRDVMRTSNFIKGDDYDLLALFNMSTMNSYYYSYYNPREKMGAVLLERIAKAGKLYWLSTENKQSSIKKLEFYEQQHAHLTWQEEQGFLRLRWQLSTQSDSLPETYYLLPTDPPG
ncbi:hypothetical protein UNDKW_1817 [Undibacterium sp. KW1]|uniref:SWIM zinc finger family protein n=1 Tax=Undibacterium sp. KW1 TaxID=2058624 RepID=UPI001331F3BE|nr:hypothetical protein [Undibacterium sp. KW1]BBB60090.1 hypothetical protein UNDKW_1817 [Undibacterium sp. KW1]